MTIQCINEINEEYGVEMLTVETHNYTIRVRNNITGDLMTASVNVDSFKNFKIISDADINEYINEYLKSELKSEITFHPDIYYPILQKYGITGKLEELGL